MTGSRVTAPRERGALVLPLVLVLLGLAALAVLAQRLPVALRQEQALRAARQGQAEVAAQSGLAWAWAMANDPRPQDEACAPSATGRSARERWWTVDTGGRPRPRGTEAACVARAAGWRCHCPVDGAAAADPGSAADEAPAPGFRVRFPDPGPDGGPRVQVDACVPWRDDCEAGAATGVRPGPEPGDESAMVATDRPRARVVQTWHGLAHQAVPRMAVLALGELRLGPATRVIGAGDGTPAVVSASAVQRAPGSVVTGAPGGLSADAVSTHRRDWQDDPLAAVPRAQRRLAFAALGADLPLAGRGPTVHRPGCGAPAVCSGAALQAAVQAGEAWLWIDGDLDLDGTLDLGDEDAPVALVVTGRLHWRGQGRLRGLLLAGGDLRLEAGPAGMDLHGALLGAGRVSLEGPLVLRQDESLLRRWRARAMPWFPRPGTWSDLGGAP